MVNESKDESELWLFEVSWTGCRHTTWEPESSISKSLVAVYRRKTKIDVSSVVESSGQTVATEVVTTKNTRGPAIHGETTADDSPGVVDALIVEDILDYREDENTGERDYLVCWDPIGKANHETWLHESAFTTIATFAGKIDMLERWKQSKYQTLAQYWSGDPAGKRT